jgi:hypothetical protein
MEINISPPQSKNQPPLDALSKRMRMLHEQGYYEESLKVSLEIIHSYPGVMDGWNGAAANCIKFARWQDVIRYVHTGLACSQNTFGYDTLALAHGQLGQWNKARRYGLRALNMRNCEFEGKPAMSLFDLPPIPPLPSVQTRQHNIISFSLFGDDSKYCETAVLNAQEQPHIYPHWICRFYVDSSVPEHVLNRLRANGAQIVQIGSPENQWPGPMWRFLALNDSQAHRILFRDADSVISLREAHAVDQWLTSDKRFHIMRDWCSHTELILAGLWGVVRGSLPPLDKLIEKFMITPPESRHFSDQTFLRQYIWPYARTSLMQHDSIFGFMGGIPFPDGKRPDNFHVGCMESIPVRSPKTNLPDGVTVVWELLKIKKSDNGKTCDEIVCAYPGAIKDGIVKAYIPVRYWRWIQQEMAYMRLRVNSTI